MDLTGSKEIKLNLDMMDENYYILTESKLLLIQSMIAELEEEVKYIIDVSSFEDFF